MIRKMAKCATVLVALWWIESGFAVTAQAQDTQSLRQELQDMKQALQTMRATYEAQIAALERRLKAVETANAQVEPAPSSAATAKSEDDVFAPETKTAAVAAPESQDVFAPEPAGETEDVFAPAGATPSVAGPNAPAGTQSQEAFAPAPVAPTPVVAQGTTNWLRLGINGLFAGGASNRNQDELQRLQFGDHDPNRDGFTVQQVELSAEAAVDPYFDARSFIVFTVDDMGDSNVEVEEAYLTTRTLPWGLQVKAGQFFTEFGRHNHTHPHTWAFLDQPVIISRMFGRDSLRSQGARLSWLLPVPWFSELTVGLQNAGGATVNSFLAKGAAGIDGIVAVGGHPLIDRQVKNVGDLLYLGRWLNGFDVSPSTSVNLGVSGLWGPNTSGNTTNTSILGVDFYLKWQSLYAQRGFPFVSLQSEFINRRYVAGDPGDPTREALKDWGAYGQLLWGFKTGWVSGLRFDYADASGGLDRPSDFLRDRRKRVSPNLTWYPTEFSKFRVQYNHDWAQHLVGRGADAIWVQMEFAIGSHLAHVF